MNVGHKVIIEGRSATIVSIDGDRIQAPHRSALVQFDDGSFALRAATSLRSDTPATPPAPPVPPPPPVPERPRGRGK